MKREAQQKRSQVPGWKLSARRKYRKEMHSEETVPRTAGCTELPAQTQEQGDMPPGAPRTMYHRQQRSGTPAGAHFPSYVWHKRRWEGALPTPASLTPSSQQSAHSEVFTYRRPFWQLGTLSGSMVGDWAGPAAKATCAYLGNKGVIRVI